MLKFRAPTRHVREGWKVCTVGHARGKKKNKKRGTQKMLNCYEQSLTFCTHTHTQSSIHTKTLFQTITTFLSFSV